MKDSFPAALGDAELVHLLADLPPTTLRSESFHGLQLLAIPARNGSCVFVLDRVTGGGNGSAFGFFRFGVGCTSDSSGTFIENGFTGEALSVLKLPYHVQFSASIRFTSGIDVFVLLAKDAHSTTTVFQQTTISPVASLYQKAVRVPLRTLTVQSGLSSSTPCMLFICEA